MKIFVACNGEVVANRLGKCKEFSVYEVEDRKIINKEVVSNPGKGAEEICAFIVNNGCDILCVGGMGESAVRLLSTHGVAIGLEAKGKCDELIENLIKDEEFDFEGFADYAKHKHEGCSCGCEDESEEDCCCGHHHHDDEEDCCCGHHHHDDEEECCCGHHHEMECCEGDDDECCCGHHDEDEEEHHCCCGHHHE